MRARHHMMKGHKHGGPVKHKAGGAVHEDEAQDKKLIKKEIGKVMGDKSKRRLDKPARGDGGHIKFHHFMKRERQSEKDRMDESRPFRKAAR